ncbi:MAG: adenylate kinase family protein [Candidatus Nealsonbacteria bacterium]
MTHFRKIKNKKVIIILGPPGSGKGTQAKLLKKKFGLEYVGSGDLLRARKKKKDFTGIKISKEIDQGKRVPTPVIFKIWMDEFEKFKKKEEFKGIIIDGSPRTDLEAEMVEQALGWYGWTKNKRVLLIEISQREVIKRLTKRRMCRECGRIIPFIGEFKKLKKCDKCGGDLFTRRDDSIEGVKKRLAWYKTDVKPAVRYYQKRGELIKINGEQSIEDVFKDVLKVVK